MKVAIVVLSWNSKNYIDKCLQSLKKLKPNKQFNSEIIIVEGGSTDGSLKFLQENYPQIEMLVENKNLGYAGGNNVGLSYALKNNFDLVWIVNPDVFVDPDSLNQAVKVMVSDIKIGIIASKVYFAPGFEFHEDRYSKRDEGKVIWYAGGSNDWKNVFAVHLGINEIDKGQFEEQTEVGFATGSSMLVRVKALRAAGLLDEKYFLYYEENDLCQRIKKLGWKLMYAPKSKVWHQVGQAAGIGSSLADYYIARSRMLFGMRWAPWRTKIALIKESLKLLRTGREWQKIGIRDYYLGKFGQGSYA